MKLPLTITFCILTLVSISSATEDQYSENDYGIYLLEQDKVEEAVNSFARQIISNRNNFIAHERLISIAKDATIPSELKVLIIQYRDLKANNQLLEDKVKYYSNKVEVLKNIHDHVFLSKSSDNSKFQITDASSHDLSNPLENLISIQKLNNKVLQNQLNQELRTYSLLTDSDVLLQTDIASSNSNSHNNKDHHLVAELQNRVELSQLIIKGKDEKISQLNGQLLDLKKRVSGHDQDISLILNSKDEKLIELTRTLNLYKELLKDVKTEFKSIKSQTANLTRELNHTKEMLSDRDGLLKQSRDYLVRLQGQLKDLQSNYIELKNSAQFTKETGEEVDNAIIHMAFQLEEINQFLLAYDQSIREIYFRTNMGDINQIEKLINNRIEVRYE